MNLAETLAGHDADAPALFSKGATISHGELVDRVDRFRAALAARGVVAGDRVVISAANTWHFVVAYYAVVGLGAVAVPVNPLSPAPEVARELAIVSPTAAVVGPTGAPAFAQVDPQVLASISTIVAGPDSPIPNAVPFDDLLIDGSPAVPVLSLEPDALAVLMFTSGTAGLPKAAMLTHSNLETNQRQMLQHPGAQTLENDVVFGVLPFFHIFGLNSVLGVSLSVGAAVVLVERFDPSAAIETIQRRQVTLVAGPPTLWAALASMPSATPESLKSVRMAVSGAAKLPDVVAEMAQSRLGLTVHEAYGLTETAPAVCISSGTDAPRGSIGVPVPGLEIRIVDNDGDDVLIGDEGEIWLRGPNIFAGYWNEPEITEAVFRDGWLCTGDIAVVDDDGYLFIVDRAKDLIIVSGFNVYPAEVEATLKAHEAVADAAVVGVEHPHTGEGVRAFVQLADGHHADEDQLVEFCGTRLARYKCPTKVTFLAEIPHGLGGKTLRRDLPIDS